MVTILQKAPRDQDGRIAGHFPDRLTHRVVKQITPMEQAKLAEWQHRAVELNKQIKDFLTSLGFGPRDRLSSSIVKQLPMWAAVRFQELRLRDEELQRQKKAFPEEIGLNPKEPYKYNEDRSVVLMGKHIAHY